MIVERMRMKLLLEDGKNSPLFCGGRKFGNAVFSVMWEIENATSELLYLAKEISSKSLKISLY